MLDTVRDMRFWIPMNLTGLPASKLVAPLVGLLYKQKRHTLGP